MSERIAVCGGTFDPFHRGHIEPAALVRDELGWSRMIFIPARVQPFKQQQRAASGFHRFAMAALALESFEWCELSPMELEREGVSYTVDTLEALRTADPDAAFDWIIGDDNLEMLPKWRALERIFELANFVVLTRGRATVPQSLRHRIVAAQRRPKSGAIVLADNRQLEISSTDIRRRVRDGEAIDGLVDARVVRYIARHRLYTQDQVW